MATAPARPTSINDGWVEVHAPEQFSFEREGDTLMGEYLNAQEIIIKDKATTQYAFRCGDGKIRTCLATYDLQRKMSQVTPGRLVRIRYEGEDHSIKTQGSPLRRFQVSQKDMRAA